MSIPMLDLPGRPQFGLRTLRSLLHVRMARDLGQLVGGWVAVAAVGDVIDELFGLSYLPIQASQPPKAGFTGQSTTNTPGR